MRDWLRSLPGRDSSRRRTAALVPLTPDNAHQVRLGWYGDFSLRQLEDHLTRHPGLSFMVEGGDGHIVGGFWRRRQEIGSIVSLSPRSSGPQLLQRLLDAYRERGASLVVADYQVQQHVPLLSNEGFGVVETIVRYERSGCEVNIPVQDVALRRYDQCDEASVLQIERESFPWLWWNSPGELGWYSRLPGVEIHVLDEGSEPVGYFGFTFNGRDGHLDRIAVRRAWQGKGYGAALLARCLQRMGEIGVRRVALSTQISNRVSQAMYQRYGFERSHWSYDIRGYWLSDVPEQAHA
jgi:ribosomal protein S18 acetylase RimI-like enzyme